MTDIEQIALVLLSLFGLGIVALVAVLAAAAWEFRDWANDNERRGSRGRP